MHNERTELKETAAARKVPNYWPVPATTVWDDGITGVEDIGDAVNKRTLLVQSQPSSLKSLPMVADPLVRFLKPGVGLGESVIPFVCVLASA